MDSNIRKQLLYFFCWSVMLAFYAALFITEDLRYVLGISISLFLFGIGSRASKKGISSLPIYVQLPLAIYLLGLAIFFLFNLDFVRNSSLFLTFMLFVFPFVLLNIFEIK